MKRLKYSMIVVALTLISACTPHGANTNQSTTKPNIINPDSNDLVFANDVDDYDVVSSATGTTFGTTPPALYSKEEKANRMFWSNQPPLGILEGYYYRNERSFSGNYGMVEVVTNPQTKAIRNVQFSEFASNPYYESKYSGKNKRLSDYAFFQAANTRTDATLVTVVNGITYVEAQMRRENRLNGNFKTVKGSSSSARQGFIPLAAEMSDWIKEPFGYKYFGVARQLDNGLIARLEVITKDDAIETLRYDEYFADTQDAMRDDADKPFFRQSRYYSIDYNATTNNQFVNFANRLSTLIVEANSLDIRDETLAFNPAFATYQSLAALLNIKPSW